MLYSTALNLNMNKNAKNIKIHSEIMSKQVEKSRSLSLNASRLVSVAAKKLLRNSMHVENTQPANV